MRNKIRFYYDTCKDRKFYIVCEIKRLCLRILRYRNIKIIARRRIYPAISNFHDNIGNESLGPREPFPESGEAKKAPFRSIRTLGFPDPNPFLTSFGKRAKVLEARDRQEGGEGGKGENGNKDHETEIRPKFPRCLSSPKFPRDRSESFYGIIKLGVRLL